MFQVNSLPTVISQAAATLLNNPEAVPGLSLTSVNINGRSYGVSSWTNSDSLSNTAESYKVNSSLVIGLVVGLVCTLLTVIGLVWLYHKHKQMNAHRRLENNPNDDLLLVEKDQEYLRSPRVDDTSPEPIKTDVQSETPIVTVDQAEFQKIDYQQTDMELIVFD